MPTSEATRDTFRRDFVKLSSAALAVSDIWKMRREDGAAYIQKVTFDDKTQQGMVGGKPYVHA